MKREAKNERYACDGRERKEDRGRGRREKIEKVKERRGAMSM